MMMPIRQGPGLRARPAVPEIFMPACLATIGHRAPSLTRRPG